MNTEKGEYKDEETYKLFGIMLVVAMVVQLVPATFASEIKNDGIRGGEYTPMSWTNVNI